MTGLAGIIAVTFLLALGARSIVSRTACSSHRVIVNVAVTSEIGPVVRHIGQFFNRMHRHVSGHCASVTVTSEPPATVAAQLAGAESAGHLPGADAWIPDSSLWADLARASAAGAKRARLSGIRVASSPLVLVMPRPAAARTPAFGTSVSWRFLLPQRLGGPASALGLHVDFPDPTSSATGLAALMELQRILGRGGTDRAELARLAFHVQLIPASDGQAALASLDTPPAPASGPDSAPVTIASEQAVVQYDRAHPQQPLAVRYPAEGSFDLSYPYVLTITDPLTLAAAEEFGKVLRSPYAVSYVRYAGFRPASGTAGHWPGSYGLTSSRPRMLPQPTAGQAVAALRTWRHVSLGSRDLLLLDTSSAMATRVRRGGPDLEHVLARATGLALARFPDSTHMGLWVFPSHINDGLPYQQFVSLGPLPGPLGSLTRRQQMERIAPAARPLRDAPAPLYGTILAAYNQMLGTYQRRYVNAVLVVTAGADDSPGDISAQTLVRDLQVLYDPKRPVKIVVVMLARPGEAGNLSALRQIVATTNGQVSVITDSSQIGTVLYGALTQPLCLPSCGP
jgi:extracellular solute-binding protein